MGQGGRVYDNGFDADTLCIWSCVDVLRPGNAVASDPCRDCPLVESCTANGRALTSRFLNIESSLPLSAYRH